MDEPLGALDKKLREYMQLEIKHIQKELKVTVVYVTHDQAEALTMSDRIAIMNQGQLEQVGPPRDIYRNPTNLFVAEFIGETNFLEGVVVQCSDKFAVAQIPRGQELHFSVSKPISKGDSVTLMIRPEAAFVLGEGQKPENQVKGVVEEVIYLGELLNIVYSSLAGRHSI